VVCSWASDFEDYVLKCGGKLFKLHLDTKEWNIITTAGSVQPSSYETVSMVTIGNDLYLFGCYRYSGSDFFRLSTTTFEWELLDAPRISGSPPSARNHHGMVVVGNDIYVFGGSISGEEGRCTAVHRRVYDRQSASIALRAAYHDRSHGIP